MQWQQLEWWITSAPSIAARLDQYNTSSKEPSCQSRNLIKMSKGVMIGLGETLHQKEPGRIWWDPFTQKLAVQVSMPIHIWCTWRARWDDIRKRKFMHSVWSSDYLQNYLARSQKHCSQVWEGYTSILVIQEWRLGKNCKIVRWYWVGAWRGVST